MLEIIYYTYSETAKRALGNKAYTDRKLVIMPNNNKKILIARRYKMFVELIKKQVKNNYVPDSALAAKRSWRRQRRVHKILARTIV